MTVSGTLPSYTLKTADAGKVMAVSVLAKNGAGVGGNTLTATTEPGAPGNNTGGGNSGIIAGGSLTAGNLSVINNNSFANGVAVNSVQALVTNTDGSPVSGQIVSFTATNGAEVTPEFGTTGTDGIVLATLASTSVGTSVVTATVNGSSQTVNVAFVEVPVLKGISVNGHTFTLNDGFPSTGFAGARFTLMLSSGSARDYDWSTGDSSWVSADSEGNVTFTGKEINAGDYHCNAKSRRGPSDLYFHDKQLVY
ncbi:hypothetical protein UA45_19125 [Morganella morganii]|uniref:Big-1 domain-containing protein n=1 Tax=Morganella morganii TaxID=582 RepID=A0A0D8L3Q6_MORMO|nr:hypothetical protein UA45_19125 [Morganella morganii]